MEQKTDENASGSEDDDDDEDDDDIVGPLPPKDFLTAEQSTKYAHRKFDESFFVQLNVIKKKTFQNFQNKEENRRQ